jgi:transcriptional regulator with XRE-family HTH domain
VKAFSAMLAEWFGRTGLSSADAASVLGCPVVTFRGWLAGRSEPDYFTGCAVERQMRDGHDPLSDVRMSPAEFADALKRWRVKHGFTQREAAAAIGTSAETVRGWETQKGCPRQPALGEILRRLRMEVDVELVKAATKRPKPIEPEKFAELMRAWRRRCKLSRVQAAHALRSTGLRTMARTVWTWETARALPQRPMAVLELIHGPLAVNPPKPKLAIMEPRQFAALLSRWRRGHRITQAQACAALGLPSDQALISDYERGNAVPQPTRMRAILDAIASRPAPPPPPQIRPSPFARGLRKWRKFRGLTLAQAAAIFGCSVSALCHYENGRVEPLPHRRAAIDAIIED